MHTKTQFEWSSRNQVDGKWLTFFYTVGMGFDTGQRVYYGKNEWRDEGSAIASQTEWELRVKGVTVTVRTNTKPQEN